MKKSLLLISVSTLSFFACKQEEATPTDTTNELSISLDGTYEDQYLNNYDTVKVVFTAQGKDYTITYNGEKQVQYPNYDSTMSLCSDLTYHAFLLQTTSNTFTVKAGETLKLDLVFDPSNFSYQKENTEGSEEVKEESVEVIAVKEGPCEVCRTSTVVAPSCQTINSNGIGSFAGLLEFSVGSETKTIAVNANSIPNEGGGMVLVEAK